MKPTWIIVADGSRARLFEQERPEGRLLELKAWVHTASRLRTESLAYGPLGRASKGHTGSTSFVPRTAPREREHQRFAHELAQHLDHGLRAGQCGALVLIASNAMLGLIRRDLPATAARRVMWSAAVDLTPYDGRELSARIEALRPPRTAAAMASAQGVAPLERPSASASEAAPPVGLSPGLSP